MKSNEKQWKAMEKQGKAIGKQWKSKEKQGKAIEKQRKSQENAMETQLKTDGKSIGTQ